MHMQFITEVNTIAVDNFSIGSSYNIRFTDETLKTLTCIGKGTDFVMFQDRYPDLLFSLTMTTAASVASIDESSGGTTNYNDLSNKPQINSHTLFGNMSAGDLGLVTPSDLDDYATTAAVTTALAGKQDTLTTAQQTAVDSGITSSLVTQIGTNTTAIAGKQETLSSSQLSAVNSGIDSTKVDQIETNKNNISKQQDTTVQGGNGYAIINGIRLYMEGTPTATVELLGNKWIYKSNLYECKYLLADNPLCAISTYTDTLDLTTGSCSRYIKKYVCTGEETVSEYDSTYERFFVRIPNFVTLGNRETPIMSSHYQGIYDGRPISNVPMNSVYSGSVGDIGVYIKENDYTTASDFKDYLAAQYANNTPVTIWYAISAADTETITIPDGNTGTAEGYLTQSGTPTPTNPIYPIANGVIGWG